jgi:orotidine-5'-phosphate decarboxylase
MEIFNPKNGVVIDINCAEKSIIADIITITKEIDYVAGYQLGAGLVIRYGLKDIASLIKKQTLKPLIYDHQKFINDLPEICSGDILDNIKDSGVDGIVVLPLSGKEALKSVINKCNRINLLPIVCGDLSYPGYFSSEEGYIENDIQQKIYLDAANLGVSHLIMSCNHIERIKIYYHQLDAIIGQLKIFFTSISSTDCKELPDVCSQIKQNKAYAIFNAKFISSEEYTKNLSSFWESFKKKLDIL